MVMKFEWQNLIPAFLKNENQLTPSQVVVRFYGLVGKEKYEEAFKYLSPNFQERIWDGNVDRFADGYKHTQTIQNVSVYKEDSLSGNPELGVRYTEKLQLLCHPLLDDIKTVQHKDKDFADRNIEAFNKLMIEKLHAKQEKIDKIPHRLYYSENAVGSCLWLAEANENENPELFSRKPGTLQEFRRAVIVRTENGWKIDGLKYR